MKLWIIKTGDTFADVAHEHGDFEDLFLAALTPMAEAHADLALAVHDARHDGPPPALGDSDGLVITGSHAMVSDAEPWSEALKPWLHEAWQRNLTMFGVCYGHQLMAAALGGESGYHPAGRESGTCMVDLTEAASGDALLGTLPQRFPAQLTHAQSVLTAPPDAEVLARNVHDGYQALRYGPRQWSVQFHPEFTAPVMRAYLAHQHEALASQGQAPERLIESVVETPDASGLLARFADLVRSHADLSATP